MSFFPLIRDCQARVVYAADRALATLMWIKDLAFCGIGCDGQRASSLCWCEQDTHDTAVRVLSISEVAPRPQPLGRIHVIRRFLVLDRGGQLGSGDCNAVPSTGELYGRAQFHRVSDAHSRGHPCCRFGQRLQRSQSGDRFKDTAKGVTNYVLEVVDAQNVERGKDRRHLRWWGEANRISETNPS